MRALLLAVGIAVAAIVVGSSTVDEGEVVTLVTRSADGAGFDTQLWIVEANGRPYLRAGSPNVQWLARLRAQPAVTVRRGGEVLAFTAMPQEDPAVRTLVNEKMAEKYGFADRMWAHLGDRAHSVPILLEPRVGP